MSNWSKWGGFETFTQHKDKKIKKEEEEVVVIQLPDKKKRKEKPKSLKFGGYYGDRAKERDHQATPETLYNALDAEFHFDFDPCPLHGEEKFNGLTIPWGKSNFVNPPWSSISRWIIKAREECLNGNKVVLLIPARLNAVYWHEYILTMATEIRFIKGTVAFGDYIKDNRGIPIPVCIVIFDPKNKVVANNVIKLGPYDAVVWKQR